MTFTVEFGWWLIPALITLLAFGAAAFMSRDMGNDRFGAGAVISFGFYLMAAVASLLAWLVWALLA
ncbi:hypothetical protein [Shinella zoogloeoides]|uniref:hypothetical protein n=1 Tax=Shinella zoogloeoides TaxID=352475 RepID=UPI00299E0CE9|nr:hypothetical protein [Shinella zoogloeoides]WPE22482.1 hypothetical protein ShzoTeo12_36980 [Shinella zoogloeoides]